MAGSGGFFGGGKRGKSAPKHRSPNKKEEKRRKERAADRPAEPEVIRLDELAGARAGADTANILPFPGQSAVPDGPVPDAAAGAEAAQREAPPPDPDAFAWEDDADARPAAISLAARRRDMRPADPEDYEEETIAETYEIIEAGEDGEPETLRGYGACGKGASPKKRGRAGRVLAGICAFLMTACAVGLALYAFVARVVVMEEDAMGETVRRGEYVAVLLCDYWLDGPARGDIVLCAFPGGEGYALRRVVGMPGEMLLIREGTVYVNGRPLVERYAADCEDFGPVLVAGGGYFVMGDERAGAADSRLEAVGPVPRSGIRGRAAMALYPLETLRVFSD